MGFVFRSEAAFLGAFSGLLALQALGCVATGLSECLESAVTASRLRERDRFVALDPCTAADPSLGDLR
jgi:hypothetical protein